ncbi:MAG: phosphoribosylamine--glycine ligase [Leptospiraceae bacterium]|nr:phosphoribosylamine--glycine ligase [Leptospiraceae bacterium]
MKVLLIGSGGREHALYWKIKQSPLLTEIRVFPGNGGIPFTDLVQESLDLKNLTAVADYVRRESYDLVVVGPEDPLVDGIADALESICPVFGPSRGAAQLEGSKDYSKQFMQKYDIPTAASCTFTDFSAALKYIRSLEPPIVIKTDGLAAGKGVVVAPDLSAAEEGLRDRMERGIFGSAGQKVIIEEFMEGEETSIFALCDGTHAIPFMASQDHKRAFDGDQGPNTGGMGAYLPVPFVNADLMKQVQTEVLDRAMAGMRSEGHPYRGLLYAGLMVKGGRARVVEFNVRFGDPETQALLPLLADSVDLLDLLYKCAVGQLPANARLEFRPGASLVVVVAAEGYPGSYRKEIPLKNIDTAQSDIIFFHAGTRRTSDGSIFSTGGRILGVTALGDDLRAARLKVYETLEKIKTPGVFYRQDIGEKAL